MQRFLFFSFILLLRFSAQSQDSYPKDYFASPVGIPISLAGNFGEIRPGHLHAGFDIRTNNKEGLPVYAAADGYVSRIRISPVGYGKAIYITHPNGYISVYGHLKGFNTAIQAKTFSLQQASQSFELDTLINRELLPVKKGELIGFSGNTGSSQAPHLHFEIRDELTEMPINPYFFGYQVKDQIKPAITAILVYPLESTSSINGKHSIKKLIPKRINNSYVFNRADSLTVHGKIGFGISCYDRENESSSTNNVFSIEMQSGGKRVFYCEMGSFSFDNSRYVNAHMDYAEKEKKHQTVQRCFLVKNNLLEIYKGVLNRGIVDFKDDTLHWITFIVKDYAGNTAKLVLKVKSSAQQTIKPSTPEGVLDCFKKHRLAVKGLEVIIPDSALYDDERILIHQNPQLKTTLSPVYVVGEKTIALQKAMIVKVRGLKVPEKWRSKACLVSIDKGKFEYEGGIFTQDSVLAESKHFGKFAITLDTLPPKIQPLLKPAKTESLPDFRQLNALKFKVKDDLSGLKTYRATLDGSWVLCEYDAKNDLLIYTFNASVQPGTHHFRLEVGDEKGNTAVWEKTINR
jgi:hypothetical protein